MTACSRTALGERFDTPLRARSTRAITSNHRSKSVRVVLLHWSASSFALNGGAPAAWAASGGVIPARSDDSKRRSCRADQAKVPTIGRPLSLGLSLIHI